MADKPYEERGGGAYVRLKDGRTVREDHPEAKALLEETNAAPQSQPQKKVK